MMTSLSSSRTTTTTTGTNEPTTPIIRNPLLSDMMSTIRVISFDVTGTLITTREPVVKSYHDAMLWSRLKNPPTLSEMKMAFKVAYKEQCLASPCFGNQEGISGREWWKGTVRRVLDHSGRGGDYYNQDDFDRYFRRVYQHFGSSKGYMVLPDAQELLSTITSSTLNDQILLGITSNTPTRHMDSVLPMLGIHDHFSWFTCSQEVGYEKPAIQIFDDAYKKAQFWIPDLQKNQVLHVGDSFECDYCGAKAYGFQALLIDRTQQQQQQEHPTIQKYQDWIDAPDYPGKCDEDIQQHTITNLMQIVQFIENTQINK